MTVPTEPIARLRLVNPGLGSSLKPPPSGMQFVDWCFDVFGAGNNGFTWPLAAPSGDVGVNTCGVFSGSAANILIGWQKNIVVSTLRFHSLQNVTTIVEKNAALVHVWINYVFHTHLQTTN